MRISGRYSQLGVACVRFYFSPWVWTFHAQRRCSSLVNVGGWAAHLVVADCQRRAIL